MKKALLFVLTLVMVTSLFAGCSQDTADQYDDEWIIGKTSKEIEEKYGAFEIRQAEAEEDGLYHSTGCGYHLERGYDFFGHRKQPEKHYVISFDQNGIAYKTETYNAGA